MKDLNILDKIQIDFKYIKLKLDFNRIIVVSLFFSVVLCVILAVLNYTKITTLICLIFICISCCASTITAIYRGRELKAKIDYINEIIQLYCEVIKMLDDK